MKIGYVAAFIFVIAYLGIEAFAAAKARPRTEPDYIYQGLVTARVVAERCGEVSPEQSAGFRAFTERVLQRLRRKLGEAEPPMDAAAMEAEIEALTRSAEGEAAATLEADGCDSSTAWRLMRRYEIYARK
jgi:hypothetical protein